MSKIKMEQRKSAVKGGDTGTRREHSVISFRSFAEVVPGSKAIFTLTQYPTVLRRGLTELHCFFLACYKKQGYGQNKKKEKLTL